MGSTSSSRPDRAGARDDGVRSRVLVFVAASLGCHLLLALVPWPEQGVSAASDDEATLVELVAAAPAQRPAPVARREAASPSRPRPQPRRPVRVVGDAPRPRPREGADPGVEPRAPEPAPAPEPTREARLDLAPERAALRLLVTTQPDVVPQGRVDEMFRCARRSGGETGCSGFSPPAAREGERESSSNGEGWLEPGNGNDGWGDRGCRTCALQTAPDPYCE